MSGVWPNQWRSRCFYRFYQQLKAMQTGRISTPTIPNVSLFAISQLHLRRNGAARHHRLNVSLFVVPLVLDSTPGWKKKKVMMPCIPRYLEQNPMKSLKETGNNEEPLHAQAKIRMEAITTPSSWIYLRIEAKIVPFSIACHTHCLNGRVIFHPFISSIADKDDNRVPTRPMSRSICCITWEHF